MMGKSEDEITRCQVCGEQVKPKDYFCSHCGAEIENEQVETQLRSEAAVSSEASRKLYLKGILLFGALLFMGLALLFVNIFARRENLISNNPPSITAQTFNAANAISNKDYLSKGGNSGSDPVGEFTWAADFGDTIISDPATGPGVVFIVVVERAAGYDQSILEILPAAKVVAVDSLKGAALWEKPLPDMGKYESAQLLQEGESVCVVAYVRDVGAVVFKLDNSAAGEFAWAEPVVINGAKPLGGVIAEGQLIISMGFDVGGVYRLSGYNIDTGSLSWALTPKGKPSPPVAMSEYFAIVETMGNQEADLVIRTLDGTEVSHTTLGFNGQWSQPAVADGRLLAGGLWSFGRCMVECYDINNLDGDPIWRWDGRLASDIPPPAGFVIVGERCAFIGSVGKLVLLNISDGNNLLPDGAFEYEYINAPTSNGNLLFGATADGHITAIRISDATLRWSFDLAERMVPLAGRALAYRDGRLFCVCRGGVLVALK